MSFVIHYVETNHEREVGTVYGPRRERSLRYGVFEFDTLAELINFRMSKRSDIAFRIEGKLEDLLMKFYAINQHKRKRGRPKGAKNPCPQTYDTNSTRLSESSPMKETTPSISTSTSSSNGFENLEKSVDETISRSSAA